MLCNSEIDNFYLTQEELDDSPSRRDGITADVEAALRVFGAQLVQEATILLDLPQAVAATGQVLLQRFYCKRSFKQYNVKKMAAATTYLAIKLEECTKTRIRDVIMVFDRIYKRKEGSSRLDVLEPGSNTYHNAKDAIIKYERDLLRAFGFIVHCDHPHKLLINFAVLLKGGEEQDKERDEELLQTAWNIANDSLRTTLCVRFKSHVVACGVLFYAARKLQVPLPETDKGGWWQALGVGNEELVQVVLALHWLYQQPRAEYINVQQLLQGAGGATAGGAAGGALGFGAGPRAGGRGGGLNTPEVTTVLTGNTGLGGRGVSASPLAAGAVSQQPAGGAAAQQPRDQQQVTGPRGSEVAARGGGGGGGGPALPGVAEGNEVLSTAHQEGEGGAATRDSEAVSRPPPPGAAAPGPPAPPHARRRAASRSPSRPAGDGGRREEGGASAREEARRREGTAPQPRPSHSPRSRSRTRSRSRSRSRDRRGGGGGGGGAGTGGGRRGGDGRDAPRDRRGDDRYGRDERYGRDRPRDDRGGQYDRDRDRPRERDGGGRDRDRYSQPPSSARGGGGGGGGGAGGYARDRDRDRERDRERERERERDRERERERTAEGRDSAPPGRRGGSSAADAGADPPGGSGRRDGAAAGNGVHPRTGTAPVQSPPVGGDGGGKKDGGGGGARRGPDGGEEHGGPDVEMADVGRQGTRRGASLGAEEGGGERGAAPRRRGDGGEAEEVGAGADDEDRFPQRSGGSASQEAEGA